MKKRLLILCMAFLVCIMGSIAGCSKAEKDLVSRELKNTVETEEQEKEINISETLKLYESLEKNEAYPYTLNDSAVEFVKEHEDFFPTEDVTKLEQYMDKNIGYKHLNKSVERYGNKLFYDESMYVLDIHEEDTGNGFYLTTVHVLDKEENSFVIFYKGELPDVFKDDTVSVCGLPLGLSSFENVGGGSTIAVVLAGSSVVCKGIGSEETAEIVEETGNVSVQDESDPFKINYVVNESDEFMAGNWYQNGNGTLKFSTLEPLEDWAGWLDFGGRYITYCEPESCINFTLKNENEEPLINPVVRFEFTDVVIESVYEPFMAENHVQGIGGYAGAVLELNDSLQPGTETSVYTLYLSEALFVNGNTGTVAITLSADNYSGKTYEIPLMLKE